MQTGAGMKVFFERDRIALKKIRGTSCKRVPQNQHSYSRRRPPYRFPEDFMFRLSPEEKSEVVANCDHLKNTKYSSTLPYAFTEHGTIMVASVLNTSRAIEVSVYIVRAFVKMRKMISSQKGWQRKISQIERRLADHDEQIIELVNFIKQLLDTDPLPEKKRIGF
ncbi:MAG: ORF6N domain-containing protein [Thermodesulfobacteriota bacterium]